MLAVVFAVPFDCFLTVFVAVFFRRPPADRGLLHELGEAGRQPDIFPLSGAYMVP